MESEKGAKLLTEPNIIKKDKMKKVSDMVLVNKKWSSLFVWISLLAFIQATPKVFWVSQPVKPGETVMVYGGNWGESPTVKLNGEAIVPLRSSDSSISFVYPKHQPIGVSLGNISSEAGEASFEVNAPDIWWVHGDWGKEASPSGWVRVFGRCVSFDEKAVIRLKGAGQTVMLETSEGQNCWSVKAEVPVDLPSGDYTVDICNGLSDVFYSAGVITIEPHSEVWKTEVFDVTKYGAVANDGFDDTMAIDAGLEAIKANGGGILHFPRGRFGYTGMLEVPTNTLIRGVDMEMSQIYWLDTDMPPEALIKGTHSFGVEDIALGSGFHRNGIQAEGDNITVRRVMMRLTLLQHLVDNPEERVRREGMLHGNRAIQLTGNFIRVIGCDIYASARGNFAVKGNYGIVSDNTFFSGTVSYGGMGGERMIIENNHLLGTQALSIWGLNGGYWGNNIQPNNYDSNNEESLTTDGGFVFGGKFESCDGVDITLADGASGLGSARQLLRQMSVVHIDSGKGMGQRRQLEDVKIEKLDDGSTRVHFIVDRPWDVEPDVGSRIIGTLKRERFIYVNNVTDDSTVAMQLFNGVRDAVIAQNKTSRTGGYRIHGHRTSMFVEFLDNEIVAGNGLRGDQTGVQPATDGGIYCGRVTGTSFGVVIRGNKLNSNARIGVTRDCPNVIVENNTVKHADVGLIIHTPGTIVRGNKFDAVECPYMCSTGVLMGPGDRELGCLEGGVTLLGREAPVIFNLLIEELRALQKSDLPDVDVNAKAAAIMNRALVALADAYPDRVFDSKLATSLLGLSVGCPNWIAAKKVVDEGEAGTATLMIKVNSQLASSVTAKFTPVDIPGWEIAMPPVKVAPDKGGHAMLVITKPASRPGAFNIPSFCKVEGDGWALNFDVELVRSRNGYPVDISHFLVAGPFENKSGKLIDTVVHPPEKRIDATEIFETRDGKRGWVPMHGGSLGELFETSALSVGHAVAVLRATRPMQVRLTFKGPGTLCFLNGETVGTPHRFGRDRTVSLKQGDNVLLFVSTNVNSEKWNIGAGITFEGPLLPGELTVIPVDELPMVEALRSEEKKPPEGASLPNSEGIDWKLVSEDGFNRCRLGDSFRYNTAVALTENVLQADYYKMIMTFPESVTPPVRVECDVKGVSWRGVMLNRKGFSEDRKFWGHMQGDGYFLSLGWHNRKSNGVMRNKEEVFFDEKAPQLNKYKWQHITAMFIPPVCRVYIDGEQALEYTDDNWIEGLNEVGIMGGGMVDNIRIYTKR